MVIESRVVHACRVIHEFARYRNAQFRQWSRAYASAGDEQTTGHETQMGCFPSP